MKKQILALVIASLSMPVMAASITNGWGHSHGSTSSEIHHVGTETIKTEKRAWLEQGDKTSKTKHESTLKLREIYDAEKTGFFGSNTDYMQAGGLTMGNSYSHSTSSFQVTGAPDWGPGNDKPPYGNPGGKGYKGATYVGNTWTVSKMPNGKERVHSVDNWNTKEWFDKSSVSYNSEYTAFME